MNSYSLVLTTAEMAEADKFWPILYLLRAGLEVCRELSIFSLS